MGSSDWILKYNKQNNSKISQFADKKLSGEYSPLCLIDNAYIEDYNKTTINGLAMGGSYTGQPLHVNGSHIGAIRLKLQFANNLNFVQQIQTITFNQDFGAGAHSGEFYFTISDLVDDNNNKTETNISIKFDEGNAGAAAIEAELNGLDLVKRFGLLDVVLTSGTVAGGDALYTITWRTNGQKPLIKTIHNVKLTASGQNVSVTDVIATPGVGYTKYGLLHALKSLIIKFGGNTLYQLDDYRSWLAHYLSEMRDEYRENLLRGMGLPDPNSNGDIFFLYLPAPWATEYNLGSQAIQDSFPQHKIHPSYITYDFIMESGANICNSNGVAVLSSAIMIAEQMYDYNANIDSNSPAVKLLTDYQVLNPVINIASGVRTRYDISSLYGLVRDVTVFLVKQTNWDANNRFIFEKLDTVEIEINGELHNKKLEDGNTEKHSINFLERVNYHDEFQNPVKLRFEYQKATNGVKMYSGSLETKNLQNANIFITHSLGENAVLFVVSKKWAEYHFQDKKCFRIQ